MDLEGKVALVTGASKRVGKEIAIELAESGCNIILHHHKSDPKNTQKEIEHIGVECEILSLNLKDHDSYTGIDQLGNIDILVNSASVFHRSDFHETSLQVWEESLSVNLTAPFLMMKHVVPHMKGEDNLVVNILDGAGIRPWKNYFAHGVSKSALVHLTEATAKALAPKIRVNGIVPGPVMKTEGLEEKVWKNIYSITPMKRPGHPRHISSAVKFFAENDYITGSILRVDGGEYLTSR